MTFSFPFPSTIADLFGPFSDPDRTVGVLMSPSDPFALMLSVQLCSPVGAGGAGWDQGVWGAASWTPPGPGRWVDVSDRARGLSWVRGADQPGGRPRVGTATLTLANVDGEVSPWATTGDFATTESWLRAGLYVRFGVTRHSTSLTPHDAYLPFFAGVIDSMDEDSDSFVDGWVTLALTETTATLAQYESLALASAVGGFDGFEDRLNRLLDDASWPFGTDLSLYSNPGATYQGTTLSGDRLTELYLTGDSVGKRILSNTRGQLAVADPFSGVGLPGSTGSGIAFTGFSNDPGALELPCANVKPYATIERVLNVVSASRVGGAVQTATNPASIALYGPVTTGYGFPRNDLIIVEDSVVLAVVTEAVSQHQFDGLGIASIDVDADMSADLWYVLAWLATQGVEGAGQFSVRWIHPSGNEFKFLASLDSFTFGITMEGDQAKWTGTLSTSQGNGEFV